MFQVPDLSISDNAQLVVGAVTCIGVIGLIVLPQSKNDLPFASSPFTLRPWGHYLPPRKYGLACNTLPVGLTSTVLLSLFRQDSEEGTERRHTNDILLACMPSCLRL